jgi:hypothetical protein
MKIRSILGIFAFVAVISPVKAQDSKTTNTLEKKEKPEPTYTISKHVPRTSVAPPERTTSPVVVEPNVPTQPEGRVNPNTSTTNSVVLSPSKPATKISEHESITEVVYSISGDVGDLDNLLNLVEYKFKVNDAANAQALQSSLNYSNLLRDINTLRQQFNDRVITSGFENCSSREQNYFLSFLKEENRMDEYQFYSSKINK